MADKPHDQIIPKNNIDVVTDNKFGSGSNMPDDRTPDNEYTAPLGAMENKEPDAVGPVGNEDLVAGVEFSDAPSATGQADKPGTGTAAGGGGDNISRQAGGKTENP